MSSSQAAPKPWRARAHKIRSRVRPKVMVDPTDTARLRELLPLADVSDTDARVMALSIRAAQEIMQRRLGADVPFAVAALQWLMNSGMLEHAVVLGQRDFTSLHERGHRDRLTGLANRGALSDTLVRELASVARYGHSLALLFMDLDGFKAYNDREGHVAGDALLSDFGEMLASEVRASDLAARYGGDEFVVVAAQTNRREATKLARRLRRAVKQRWGHEHVTISVGVAMAPDDGIDAKDLIAAADDAMYLAKRNGGDAIAEAQWPRDSTV